MDWSQVLYAGIGGGAGAALGGFIALGVNKTIKDKKYHNGVRAAFVAGLAVLGMNFTKSMYADIQLPRVGSSLEKTLLEASPIYVEMKKYEPEYFEKIMETIDMSVRKGNGEATIMNEGRAVLMELFADKNKYADDEVQQVLMEITLQNYRDYKANKPYLCVQMINQRGLGDVQPYVSRASAKLEERLTIKMIRLPRTNPKLVNLALAEQSQTNMSAAMAEFVQPDDVIDPPEDSPKQVLERVCDIGSKTIELILELPENQRANYLRHILGG